MTTDAQLRALPPLQVKIREAAEILRYDDSTIRRMIARGELPAIGRGRLRRIAFKDLEAWIERNREGA